MMTRILAGLINDERLRSWANRLTEANATALVLIGVGHGERAGEIHVIRTEDGPTGRELAGFLRYAAEGLERADE